MLICARCREELPSARFYRDRCSGDGFESRCKACREPRDFSIERLKRRAREARARKCEVVLA
jgi:hypothetical protein